MNVWKSEALWTAITALVLSVAGFAATNYIADPKMVELAKTLILGMNGVAAILIAGFTVKDVAAMKYFKVSSYRQIPK
jgi:hypothetical protein